MVQESAPPATTTGYASRCAPRALHSYSTAHQPHETTMNYPTWPAHTAHSGLLSCTFKSCQGYGMPDSVRTAQSRFHQGSESRKICARLSSAPKVAPRKCSSTPGCDSCMHRANALAASDADSRISAISAADLCHLSAHRPLSHRQHHYCPECELHDTFARHVIAFDSIVAVTAACVST